jgi:transposase
MDSGVKFENFGVRHRSDLGYIRCARHRQRTKKRFESMYDASSSRSEVAAGITVAI